MSDDDLPQVDLQAKGVVESTCEFCKRKYWIMPEEMQVAHQLPMCAEFQAMELIAFLQANRKIKEEKVVKA